MTCADVSVWHHPRADVAIREMDKAHVSAWGPWRPCVLACEAREGYRSRVAARAREAETSASVWRRVWGAFWPFSVGFCLGLSVLSLNAFALTVGWAERWDPRVVGTVGMTTVTRFWQWLLDEGKGSGRMPEMSTGTRKSEEWLWYHVNNIKCERKTK